jgi:hypothetical protein
MTRMPKRKGEKMRNMGWWERQEEQNDTNNPEAT